MNNAQLVLPDVRYENSYRAAIAEYKEAGSPKEHFEEPHEEFEHFVAKIRSKAQGENLPAGFVPQTDYWLVDGEEYIGSLSIRHKLTDHLREVGGHIGYGIRPSKRKMGYGKLILKLGLEKAKKMGIEKALLTCDVTNEGSRKIIEGNGGVLENTVPNPGSPDKARFWIPTSGVE